jgi:hypothetical protein
MRNLLRAFARPALLVGVLALTAGCTVHQTEVPGLAGPSEFALTFRVTATPDHVAQDGVSQATMLVTAINSTGGPAKGVTFVLYMNQDYGLLSPTTVVTDKDGRATAVYTAPLAPPNGGSGEIRLYAEPVGSNYETAVSEYASILLLPAGY